MFKVSCLIALLVCCVNFLDAQVLYFDVIKGTKKLGNMTVKRNLLEDGVTYEIDSEVTFRILLSFTIDYESTSEYKNGLLIKEYTHNQLNGTTQKKSSMWREGDHYQLDLDGSKITIKESITYSVATIYFREPSDKQPVYSPQFAKFLQFEKTGDHQYTLESPDGTNVYYYTNGICTEVKVYRDFAKFSFVMTPESLIAVKNKKIVGGSATVE